MAAKLGYKHNAIAAGLRNNRSNTIGLIVPRISMFYQSAVVTAIQNKLHEYKYNLMVCQSNESVEMERELVNALYASRVEGLIVSATLNTVDFLISMFFRKAVVPSYSSIVYPLITRQIKLKAMSTMAGF